MPGSSNGSAPTPPSAPSSAPEGGGRAPSPPPRARGGWPLALVAGAAAASSWNPLGAPFAVVAGVLCAILAVRALSRGRARGPAAAALALGAGAALAGVMVLLAAAGLGIRPEEKLGVEPRGEQEVRRTLDDAAARTGAARERARRELQELPAGPAPKPAPTSR